MPTVLLTGGTGLIGTALTELLVSKGFQVIILSRSKKGLQNPNVGYAVWDINNQTIDENAIASADYIVHLAGAGIADEKWTDKRKKELVESRTKSSELLVKALKHTSNKVKAIISASAIGWYGDDKNRGGKKAFTEEMPADKSFLGETCKLWEQSIQPVSQLAKRLVIFRFGIVLSSNGGALPEFEKPLKFGIAGMLGSGKQVISWIHVEDLCRMILFAIEHEELNGIYNAVSPAPVTNKDLTLQLAKRLKGKFFIPLHVPAFALRFMLGEMSIEVLKSATVSSQKIIESGFTFLYPSIESALAQLIKTR